MEDLLVVEPSIEERHTAAVQRATLRGVDLCRRGEKADLASRRLGIREDSGGVFGEPAKPAGFGVQGVYLRYLASLVANERNGPIVGQKRDPRERRRILVPLHAREFPRQQGPGDHFLL